MHDPSSEAGTYGVQIDEFLLQLSKELQSQNMSLTGPFTNQELLEQHLMEINSFYYQSFHERFMPQYLESIEANLRHIYNVHQQDEVLKKNILASLKHNLRWFNRIKTALTLLKKQRQQTEPHWLAIQHSNDARCADLLYLLKEHHNHWSHILNKFRQVQSLLDDQQLMTALSQYPFCGGAASLFAAWQPGNSKVARSVHRLLAAWQLATRLLIKLQENPVPGKAQLMQMISELQSIDASWDTRKNIPAIRNWYQQHIQKTYLLYLEALQLNGEKSDRKRTSNVAGQFESWLNALRYVLEQTMLFNKDGGDNLFMSLPSLNLIDKNYCSGLITYSAQIIKSLNDLIKSLDSHNQAEYKNHSKRAGQVLSAARQYWHEQLNSPSPLPPFIITALERSINQVSLCENRLETLDERYQYEEIANQQYTSLMDSLDYHIEQLTALKDQLDRQLIRKYSADFTGINFSINHITIARGALLPDRFSYLVENGTIETSISNEPPGQVLHEEGDIFLIELDDIKVEEVPRIVIARKG